MRLANRAFGSVVMLGMGVLVALGGPASAREISFEERVQAQRAIEQVYWNHRIWPKENRGSKPALATVLPDAAIRARVEDYLKKSNALEKWWERAITPQQLQAEIDRMMARTRDAAVLHELFEALGNDPQLIAETLVRQTLADRLIRNWYAQDDRFHRGQERQAEAAIAACKSPTCMRAMGGTYVEASWRLDDRDVRPQLDLEGSGRVVRLSADEWKQKAALPVGQLSSLEERADSFVVTSVVSRRADEITTASVVWAKRSFESWWAGQRASTDSRLTSVPGDYSLPLAPLVGCVEDTWESTFTEFPDPSRAATAIWTGTEMIVWGVSNSGTGVGQAGITAGRYNPATDSWVLIPRSGSEPSERTEHTSVWTGTEMIIWGGQVNPSSAPTPPRLNTGGRYNPTTDTWTETTVVGAPIARYLHTATWTGDAMIVWGGHAIGVGNLNTGGRYDPVTDSWTPTSTGANVPAARNSHSAVWADTELIVWGGVGGAGVLNSGGRYDPDTDSWVATSTTVATARYAHTAVWTGTEMLVWGGRGSGNAAMGLGYRYAPATDSWTPMSNVSGPSSRFAHTAVWSGSEMIIWGGMFDSPSTRVNTGGRYDPSTNSWAPTSTGPNVPSARHDHVAVWADGEMIVWGGGTQFLHPESLDSGARYDPSTDSWLPTSLGATVPGARHFASVVWTGSEMIVWGGQSGDLRINTGGRYTPAIDAWSPTSTAPGVPSERAGHGAVWTGAEMIVWGGYSMVAFENTGARYDPSTDSWTATSTGSNTPQARYGFQMVWTGSEVIVWGGGVGFQSDVTIFNTGGRYSPETDTWVPTSTVDAPFTPNATVVWTGVEMIVWGGCLSDSYLDSGARYRPSTDSWTATSTGPGVASPRCFHSAVWTGSEMIVWGGFDGTAINTGGRYSPSLNSWSTTSTGSNVPSARALHAGVWTGSEMIVWGGIDPSVPTAAGARYTPAGDIWTPTSQAGDPPPGRASPLAVWTGTQMIVWGSRSSMGGLYCAASCATPTVWYQDHDGDGYGTPRVTVPACAQPTGFSADGGDCDDLSDAIHPGASESCNNVDDDCDGQLDEGLTQPTTCGVGYCASTGVATCVGGTVQDNCVPGPPLSATDPTCDTVDDDCSGQADEDFPSQPTSCGIGACARTGATFCSGGSVQNSCTPGPPLPSDTTCNGIDENCNGQVDEMFTSTSDGWNYTSQTFAPEPRTQFVAVSTGTSMIVWGGLSPTPLLSSGGVYTPTTNSWTSTANFGAPSPRLNSAGVWTGSEMLVWGGFDNNYLNTGGRYNPATNSWSAMAIPAIAGRESHTAVWTGSRMVVWGGRTGNLTETNSGGSYVPSTNTWSSMLASGPPTARFNHTAIWTGSRMVVWGGETVFGVEMGTGGIYDPVADTWTPTSLTNAPSARTRHTAVWTGSRMIVLGGFNGLNLQDGASFDPATNTWTPIPPMPLAGRWGHVAVWNSLDGLMIVWGGFSNAPLGDGARYNPTTLTWSPMAAVHLEPRRRAAGLFLAGQTIIWGGDAGNPLGTGARYTAVPSTCGLGACTRQSASRCTGGIQSYACTPGTPSAESCNQIDDDCDGMPDDNVGGTPGTPCLQAGKGSGFALTTNVRWVAIASAVSYDVIRGSLSSLRSSAGNYTAATTACIANDIAILSATELTDPPVGDGLFHLLRANFSGGPGTYDETHPNQIGSRDAEIAASPNACP